MRPKLKEEGQEIDKMSVHILNYYQDAEAHIDELEKDVDKLDNLEQLCNLIVDENWSNTVDIRRALKEALK